jgi:hypothetical protein
MHLIAEQEFADLLHTGGGFATGQARARNRGCGALGVR